MTIYVGDVKRKLSRSQIEDMNYKSNGYPIRNGVKKGIDDQNLGCCLSSRMQTLTSIPTKACTSVIFIIRSLAFLLLTEDFQLFLMF